MCILCVLGAGAAAAFAEGAPPAGPEPAPVHIAPWQAAVLGAIQGLTEYLPVSSTGHLILANYAMGLSWFSDRVGPFGRVIEENQAVDAFDIVLHAGTVLAVLGLYRRRVVQMARGLVGRDPPGLRLLVALAIAAVPAGIVGLLGKHWIEQNLFNPLTVTAALVVGGVLMIVIEHFFWRRRRDAPRTAHVDRVLYWQALVIGLAQCLALWPGTSRSMVTILAALVVGLDMLAAAEFSFLLMLPTVGMATAYAILKHARELEQAAGADGIIIGLVVTVVVGALAIKGFVKWLTGHGLWPFGIYRIALAAAVFAYFATAK
jgi:undecaprenyl-diphosphatase